ncbi:MAG: PKD domain-containing protein, partial [Bacteroidetes bacterium]|nr:PKD domain-containing protein [Bacteroidota bacterium]
MYRRLLPLLLTLLFNLPADAQKESANWYFGQGLGVSFNTGLPADISGIPGNGLSPSTSVSDANGNLQFIFGSGRVYDRNYSSMPGNPLFQLGISWNLVLAAPVPSSPARYYLFYTTSLGTDASQLRYAIVDMSLNGGLGQVVSADNLIDNRLSPAFTLVHRHGTDEFWVVCHKHETTTFNAYAVTAAGISTVPVSSQAGTDPNLNDYYFHDMKTSPNGKMIAGIGYYQDYSSIFEIDRYFLEVFNFDGQSGTVTNKIRTLVTGYVYQNAHFCCFSPDNRLIYAGYSTIAPGLQPCGLAGTNLVQYNLCYNNIDTFTLYAPMISQTIAICTYPFWGKMQIGLDKKIYMPYASTTTLSAIDFPNRIGTSSTPNFPERTLPKACDYGLPDFYHDFIFKGAGNNIVYNGGCYPQPTHFSITNEDISNIQWDFGDAGSGSTNSATGPTPDHSFSAPGIYTVTARLYSSSNSLIETLTDLVEIRDPGKRLLDNYPKDTTLCGGDSRLLKLRVINGIFSWHFHSEATGNYFSAGIADSLYIGSLGTGTYYVEMRQNDCDGCRMTDSIHVTVQPRPSFSLGSDTYVCTGDSLALTVYDQTADVLWNNGATTHSIEVKKAGTYSVTAEYDHNGCPRSDTIIITERPGVQFALPNDTTLCEGSTLLLDPEVPQASYQWQDYSNATTYLVKDPGQYRVRITNTSFCSKSDTIDVAYVSASSVYLGADTTLCEGDSLLLAPALP